MKYYIGVDGGGTKTQYALFDENKNMLASVKTDGSNHENMEGSFDAAADIILQGINSLLAEMRLNMEDITATLLALAGIDHPYQHDIMCEKLSTRGLHRFSVYNDGFIVIKAAAPFGIGYNCGTGTCCNSIDEDGNMLQVGGFGELSMDVGNGHWIARETFRLLYDAICLRKNETLLTSLAMRTFGIEDTRESLLAAIPAMEAGDESTIRSLIDIFFEAVNAEDAAALQLLDCMAQRGADFINAHLKQQKFSGENVRVVLSGSIHTKLPSQKYIAALHERAERDSGRKLDFVVLSVAPVTGCINWMLEK